MKKISTSKSWLACLPLAVLSLCFEADDDKGIYGNWRSIEDIEGNNNELFVVHDGSGTATIHFYLGDEPDLYSADFWVDESYESASDSYTLQMRCREDCDVLDFEMTCLLDEDTLECYGSGAFSDYSALLFLREG